jgi:nucleotide-binding universal stress UspA family protein
VTVALDATAESAPVLEFAFRHAALRRLPLRVIHYVYDVRSTLVGVPMTGDLSVTTQEHALAVSESLAGLREEYPDVHLSVTTEPGVPQEELGARSRRAALLVVGSHHQSLIGRLLTGSVSTEVLQRVHCPVAVVPVGWRRMIATQRSTGQVRSRVPRTRVVRPCRPTSRRTRLAVSGMRRRRLPTARTNRCRTEG